MLIDDDYTFMGRCEATLPLLQVYADGRITEFPDGSSGMTIGNRTILTKEGFKIIYIVSKEK